MSLPRVLVVDDSAFARKVVREVLERSGAVEVVGFARDGLEAVERIAALSPDVVTLDLMLPHLDGVGVLEALQSLGSEAPRVVVVTSLGSDAEAAVQALQLGALELVQKPTSTAAAVLYEVASELLAAVLRASVASPRHLPEVLSTPPPSSVASVGAPRVSNVSLVVLGTSTGGPQALTQLIGTLPPLPVPLVLVVHIPAGYTEALAARLDRNAPARVVEAVDGARLVPGVVTVARAGTHCRIDRQQGALVLRLSDEPADALHRPSVDVLFGSAAEHCGAGVLGVVLTGMGNDGLIGARAIHRAGGRIFTESEASCVVYGMPRVIDEAGLAESTTVIEDMARLIVEAL